MEENIVVRYTVKPEAIDEHVRLIQGVFEQLHRERPAGVVGYHVLRLNDGETFVHVSTHDTTDGSNPLPELSAFKEFGRDIASRVSTPPNPTPGTTIGSYRSDSPSN
jgi:hypothetical protein